MELIYFGHLAKYGCSILELVGVCWVPKIWKRWSPTRLGWGARLVPWKHDHPHGGYHAEWSF